MSHRHSQGAFTRGVYEFEDPTGIVIAAKTPPFGSADLFDGTAVSVKPNQCALFIYKGQIADVLPAGLHYVKTENLPVVAPHSSPRNRAASGDPGGT